MRRMPSIKVAILTNHAVKEPKVVLIQWSNHWSILVSRPAFSASSDGTSEVRRRSLRRAKRACQMKPRCWGLCCYNKITWLMTNEASFLNIPRDCVGTWFNSSNHRSALWVVVALQNCLKRVFDGMLLLIAISNQEITIFAFSMMSQMHNNKTFIIIIIIA